jgi:hypothetical protein
MDKKEPTRFTGMLLTLLVLGVAMVMYFMWSQGGLGEEITEPVREDFSSCEGNVTEEVVYIKATCVSSWSGTRRTAKGCELKSVWENSNMKDWLTKNNCY